MQNQIVVWGENENGQVAGAPHGVGFAQILPGGSTQTVAIRTDGSVELWGQGSIPPLSWGPLVKFNDLLIGGAIGASHFVGIRQDHSLVSWGNFLSGASAEPPAGLRVKAVAVGAEHGVGLDMKRELTTPWGSGDGTTKPPPGTFMKIRARSGYTIALRDDGRLYGWGSVFATPAMESWDGWERDGDGYWFAQGPYKDLAAGPQGGGEAHILALNEDGNIDGWGRDDFGQATKEPPGVLFKAIGAGFGYSIGLDVSGRLHHWGMDWGANTIAAQTAPFGPRQRGLAVVPIGRFEAISAGSHHATALRLSQITINAEPDAREQTLKQPSLESRSSDLAGH